MSPSSFYAASVAKRKAGERILSWDQDLIDSWTWNHGHSSGHPFCDYDKQVEMAAEQLAARVSSPTIPERYQNLLHAL